MIDDRIEISHTRARTDASDLSGEVGFIPLVEGLEMHFWPARSDADSDWTDDVAQHERVGCSVLPFFPCFFFLCVCARHFSLIFRLESLVRWLSLAQASSRHEDGGKDRSHFGEIFALHAVEVTSYGHR